MTAAPARRETTMTIRVGINGFGRIGRSFQRVALDRGSAAGIQVVAVNEPNAEAATLAFLLQHDSVAGESDVDIVVEASGRFRSRAAAGSHVGRGVRRVVVSAPGKGMDMTICMGVNDAAYAPLITPWCPTLRARRTACAHGTGARRAVRLGHGFMTTVHAYTSDQALLDQPRVGRAGQSDVRRMRAAALSIVPTSTGASRAVGEVLPNSRDASTASRFASRSPSAPSSTSSPPSTATRPPRR